MRGATTLAIVFSLLSLGCEEGAPSTAPSSSLADVPTPPRPEPPSPWAVRFVRPCSEWSYATARAGTREVVTCDNAVHHAGTGALLRFAPSGHRLVGSRGALTYWDADGAILADDGAGEPVAIPGALFAEDPAATGDLVAYGDGAFHRLRGTVAERIAGSEICDRAVGVRADGDVVQCIVREDDGTSLRTVGQQARRALPRLHAARWTGSHWIAVGDGRVHWIDDTGAVVHTRDAVEPDLLDVSIAGALVSSDGRTEIWRLEGGELIAEPVYARASQEGAFAGEQIVLLLESRSVVWLHRGEPRSLPELGAPAPPSGFVALRPEVDGESASFEGEAGTFNRGPNDVAAFSRDRPWAYVIVSRSDSFELSGFHDDAEWAVMAAARYIDDGEERWARRWRDETGRVVRGHVYIGGCERAHVDVLIRERGDVLETWTAYTQRGRGLEAILGSTPEGAADVSEAAADRYRGDPSIGAIREEPGGG